MKTDRGFQFSDFSSTGRRIYPNTDLPSDKPTNLTKLPFSPIKSKPTNFPSRSRRAKESFWPSFSRNYAAAKASPKPQRAFLTFLRTHATKSATVFFVVLLAIFFLRSFLSLLSVSDKQTHTESEQPDFAYLENAFAVQKEALAALGRKVALLAQVPQTAGGEVDLSAVFDKIAELAVQNEQLKQTLAVTSAELRELQQRVATTKGKEEALAVLSEVDLLAGAVFTAENVVRRGPIAFFFPGLAKSLATRNVSNFRSGVACLRFAGNGGSATFKLGKRKVFNELVFRQAEMYRGTRLTVFVSPQVFKREDLGYRSRHLRDSLLVLEIAPQPNPEIRTVEQNGNLVVYLKSPYETMSLTVAVQNNKKTCVLCAVEMYYNYVEQ